MSKTHDKLDDLTKQMKWFRDREADHYLSVVEMLALVLDRLPAPPSPPRTYTVDEILDLVRYQIMTAHEARRLLEMDPA